MRIIRLFCFGCYILLSIKPAQAQDYKEEIWAGYIGSITIHPHWRIWNDYQYISASVGMARFGITYQTKQAYQFTTGYAYVKTSTANTKQLVRGENRLWAQVLKNYRITHQLNYIVRLRYDGRFRQMLDNNANILDDSFTFNHRYRVMQDLRFRISPVQKEKFWHADLINETLVNSGKNIRNGLDQLRSYLMLGYTQPNLTVLAGYHQRFFPAAGQRWSLHQGFTVWMIHNVSIARQGKE